MLNERVEESHETDARAAATMVFERPDESLRVVYNDPEQQLVDFFSRFGVWWDADTPGFGIDHGCISSQREGKHFMAPLAQVTVLDVDTGESMFDELNEQPSGFAWGFVQEGETNGLRLIVTVAYADLDVVAVKVAIENTGVRLRQLRLCIRAAAVGEDRIKPVVFHEASSDGEVITLQTAAPTSRFQLRAEPHLDIVSGWKTDFRISQHDSPLGGFCAAGDSFFLSPSESRDFSLYVSAASSDHESGKGLIPLVHERLAAQTTHVDRVIQSARQRWSQIFAQLPDDLLKQRWKDYLGDDERDEAFAEQTPPLVHRAMMILLRNTIKPQPEQDYGESMGSLRGTFPSRFSYEGFWMWDSAFQALGFSEWDLELAKENVRIMLSNQDDDNGLRMLHPNSSIPSAQPPLFSWVVMEIYEKERQIDEGLAREFLHEVYPELSLWNDWWFRNRDTNGSGLCEWGNNLESGWDDSPRWDNADGQAGWNNDNGARLYKAVDLNAYLIKDLRSLSRMARVLVDTYGPEAARDWDKKADRLSQLVVDFLYDPQDNLFYDADYVTGQPHKLLTPACLLPLWAGVPLPKARVRKMIETYLLSPEYFYGPYPFPTVAYDQQAYDASGRSGYWRGPVWLNIAYFMIELLAWHGYRKEAHEASLRILGMVSRAGLHENYNSRTGWPGDNSRKDYSWSAAMAITIAMGDLTRGRPTNTYPDTLELPTLHIAFRVRDRKIYGHGKEAVLHVANRTNETIRGTLKFSLPASWKLQTHDAVCDAEHCWSIVDDAQLPFELGPHSRFERPVRFVIPSPVEEVGSEYPIHVEALAKDGPWLGDAEMRLEGPAVEPLRWLKEDTAASFLSLLHTGAPFCWRHDGDEIGRSAPGLVGLLDGQLRFLGNQASSVHLGQRDFIKHALKLVRPLPTAGTLRRAFERLLIDGSPQDAERKARELLELVVQQTRDLTAGLTS